MKNEKYKLLRKGILYDLIGMSTMVIPVVGPFLDLLWAPVASKKMREMPRRKSSLGTCFLGRDPSHYRRYPHFYTYVALYVCLEETADTANY